MMTDTSDFTALAYDLSTTCCSQPFTLLGIHSNQKEGVFTVRVWQPTVSSLTMFDIVTDRIVGDLKPFHDDIKGFYELILTAENLPSVYGFQGETDTGETVAWVDPYQFGEYCLSQTDIEFHKLHHHLGAHLHTHKFIDKTGLHAKVEGVLFKVYAPNARNISVIGSFNGWDGRLHPMASADDGIWRLFIPDARPGDLYKFEIRSQKGNLLPYKADPFGFYAEQAPGNASIVYDHDKYQWNDEKWLPDSGQHKPISIYEVHAGSWKKSGNDFLTYDQLTDELIPYVIEMGFTHIEFMPLTEHPFFGSWGYQSIGLFAPTSRYGAPDDFKKFVDTCHNSGIGVILDWVPAHFPEDNHGLVQFDGSSLFEYQDPKRGWHPDWKTLIYDYGNPFVRHFLISNALFWFEKFHLDGLRVDAVASMLYLDYSRQSGEWEPNIHGGNEHLEAIYFLKELNEAVFHYYPYSMMFAEESTSWPGVSQPTYNNGLGFSFKWNMGWMHDSLAYMSQLPIHRKHHHNEITFSMEYHYSEHFVLPLSHDEVVHGKGTILTRMPGDEWQRFANLRAYYGFMFAHPGKKLLFMGAELGTDREWNHDSELDWWLLDKNSFCRGIQHLIRDLNNIYREHSSFWQYDYDQKGFQWVVSDDNDQSVIGFIRQEGIQNSILVISNMTPVIRYNYRIGVPAAGYWHEILNTDNAIYGGSDVNNPDRILSTNLAIHNQNSSLALTLPPLSTVYLKHSH